MVDPVVVPWQFNPARERSLLCPSIDEPMRGILKNGIVKHPKFPSLGNVADVFPNPTQLVLEAQVEGKLCKLLVDTGAALSLVDNNFLKDHIKICQSKISKQKETPTIL